MNRPMRRSRQALALETIQEILARRTAGVLAMNDESGYPYAVPLSYVWHQDKIYFHSATSGHKIDALRKDDRVSFCVIDADEIVADEYTTYFRSAMVYGRARLLEGSQEKRQALDLLGKKYAPDHDQDRRAGAIERELDRVTIIELTIEGISGKEAIELVRSKSENP